VLSFGADETDKEADEEGSEVEDYAEEGEGAVAETQSEVSLFQLFTCEQEHTK
jgi:hypothetical protein